MEILTLLLVILLVVLVFMVLTRQSELESEVRRLAWALTPDVSRPESPEPRPTATTSPPHTRPRPGPASPPSEPVKAPVAARPATGTPAQPVEVQAPPRPGRNLESLIGKTWLVRIGAAVLLIGMGFLYKHSVEQGWISEGWRVVTGCAGGVVLWGLGLRFQRQRYTALAQGFAGCGSAMLYLSVFAAYALYDLVGQPIAFGAMVAITAVTVFLALRQNALPLAILAQLGGFLTPLLLDAIQISPLVLFGYLVILDSGLMVASWARRWQVLDWISWVGTALIYLVWIQGPRPVTGLWVAPGWATALALLFVGGAVLRPLKQHLSFHPWTLALLALNAGAWTSVCWLTLLDHPVPVGGLALGMGLLHLALAQTHARWTPVDRPGHEILRGVGTALAVASVPLLLESNGITLGWSLLAVVFIQLGSRLRSEVFTLGGAVALAGALFRVATEHFHLYTTPGATTSPAFLNGHFLTSLAVMASVFAAAWVEKRLRLTLAIMGGLGVLGVLAREIQIALAQTYGPSDATEIAVHLIWCILATAGTLAFAVVARRTRRPEPAVVATVLASVGVALFVVRLSALQNPPVLFIVNARFLQLLAVPCGLAVTARVLDHESLRGLPSPGPVFRWAALTLPLLLLSFEAWHHFHAVGGGSAGAALSVTWTLYAAGLLVLGILQRRAPVRIAALLLLAATLVKVVVVDLASLDQVYRIVSFIVLGLILMGGAWLYHRFAPRLFAEG